MKDKPLTCHYGVPWLDHFRPPVGTGRGCNKCGLTFREK